MKLGDLTSCHYSSIPVSSYPSMCMIRLRILKVVGVVSDREVVL